MTLLWVALAMAAKDALGVLLVIAESRGRALLAGTLDALGDLAMVLTTVYGAGEVITHGWTAYTAEILAVMVTTSFVGTIFWTWFGKRIKSG